MQTEQLTAYRKQTRPLRCQRGSNEKSRGERIPEQQLAASQGLYIRTQPKLPFTIQHSALELVSLPVLIFLINNTLFTSKNIQDLIPHSNEWSNTYVYEVYILLYAHQSLPFQKEALTRSAGRTCRFTACRHAGVTLLTAADTCA